MRERHVHACLTAVDFDPCIEVLRERLDEGCSQAALRRRAYDIRLSDPIIRHRKLPIRSVDLVADDDPTVWPVFGKCVFQSVDHELGDDKAEADGLGGLGRAAVDQNFQRDRPALTDHRSREAFAQTRQVGANLNLVVTLGSVKMLLHGRHRHNALMRVLQMQTRFLRGHCARLQHQDAGDDLKTVGDTVLHFPE